MRHQVKRHKIGRGHAHRAATLASLSSALIQHKRIRTTFTKAKALRVYVEPLITRCKEDTTHNRREVFKHLQNKHAIKELFGDIAVQVGDRPGGYTRIVKLGPRPGDSAEMAIIELVDYNDTEQDATTGGRSRRTRRGGGRGRRGKKGGAQQATPAPTTTDVETTETVIPEKGPETATVEHPVSEETQKPVAERSQPHAEAQEAADEAAEASEADQDQDEDEGKE